MRNIVAFFVMIVISTGALGDSFFALNEYKSWLQKNKEDLLAIVQSVRSNDLYSIRYHGEGSVSYKTDYGGFSNEYKFNDRAFIERMLSTSYINFLRNDGKVFLFYNLKASRCLDKTCYVAIVHTKDELEMEFCTAEMLNEKKGECIFSVEKEYYLWYRWLSQEWKLRGPKN